MSFSNISFSQGKYNGLSRREILSKYTQVQDSNIRNILLNKRWVLKYKVSRKVFKKIEIVNGQYECEYNAAGVVTDYHEKGQEFKYPYQILGENIEFYTIVVLPDGGVEKSTYDIIKLNTNYMILDLYADRKGKLKKIRRLVYFDKNHVK